MFFSRCTVFLKHCSFFYFNRFFFFGPVVQHTWPLPSTRNVFIWRRWADQGPHPPRVPLRTEIWTTNCTCQWTLCRGPPLSSEDLDSSVISNQQEGDGKTQPFLCMNIIGKCRRVFQFRQLGILFFFPFVMVCDNISKMVIIPTTLLALHLDNCSFFVSFCFFNFCTGWLHSVPLHIIMWRSVRSIYALNLDKREHMYT